MQGTLRTENTMYCDNGISRMSALYYFKVETVGNVHEKNQSDRV